MNTQQVQIESLSLVNREQRQQLIELDGESETESLPSSVESLSSRGNRSEKEPVEVASQIEALESLWEQHQAEVDSIQREQYDLFHKLGEKNLDATTKIDKLCREFSNEEEPGTDSSSILVNAGELLDTNEEKDEM